MQRMAVGIVAIGRQKGASLLSQSARAMGALAPHRPPARLMGKESRAA
jgi:hypothetical protein